MEQKKYLDLEGLKHYNRKLKDGTILVGLANTANNVSSSDIQWGSDTVPLANIPKAAMERCLVVANDTARFNLTKEQVQNGDSVKVTDTKKMYFIKDDNNLNNENGYEIYTTGTVSQITEVEWNDVKNKPTKFKPEEHGSDVVTKLDGYTPQSSATGEYNRLSPTDSLNEALLKLQQNTDRLFKTINVANLDDAIPPTSERFKQLVSDNYVIQYTIICNIGDKKIPCGVLYEFSDVGKTNITQVATTSLNLSNTNGGYEMHSAPTTWFRRFKVRSYPTDQLNKWSKWEPCISKDTTNFIKNKIMIKFGGIVNGVSIETQLTNETNGKIVFDKSINKLLFKVGFKYYKMWSTYHFVGEENSGSVIPFEDVFYYDIVDGGIYVWDGREFKPMFNKTIAITTSEIDDAING